jgi:hypothetical protein
VKQKEPTIDEYTKYGRGNQMKLVKTYKLIENTPKNECVFFIYSNMKFILEFKSFYDEIPL